MMPFNDAHLFKFVVGASLFVLVETMDTLGQLLPAQLALALSAIIKVYPMVELNRFVLKKISSTDKYVTWVWVGLGCSTAGDAFLVYHHKYPVTFLLGLFMFLIAHVFYLRAFGYNKFHTIIFLLCVVEGLTVFAFLFTGKLGDESTFMQVSCVAYGVALFGMQWRAWARVKRFSLKRGDWQILAAAIGAFLFVVSDIVLATEKFRLHIPATRLWNMSTYYAGQMFIAVSTHKR